MQAILTYKWVLRTASVYQCHLIQGWFGFQARQSRLLCSPDQVNQHRWIHRWHCFTRLRRSKLRGNFDVLLSWIASLKLSLCTCNSKEWIRRLEIRTTCSNPKKITLSSWWFAVVRDNWASKQVPWFQRNLGVNALLSLKSIKVFRSTEFGTATCTRDLFIMSKYTLLLFMAIIHMSDACARNYEVRMAIHCTGKWSAFSIEVLLGLVRLKDKPHSGSKSE